MADQYTVIVNGTPARVYGSLRPAERNAEEIVAGFALTGDEGRVSILRTGTKSMALRRVTAVYEPATNTVAVIWAAWKKA